MTHWLKLYIGIFSFFKKRIGSYTELLTFYMVFCFRERKVKCYPEI